MDQLLDHEALTDAVLSQNGHLSISAQFYFYILTRRVLRRAGLEDRALCDYLASLLDEFTRTAALRQPVPGSGGKDGAGVGLPLRPAAGVARGHVRRKTFVLRAKLGDYTLFLTGIFPENIERRRCRRGAPGCLFYEEMGRTSYLAAARHEAARHRGLTDVFNGLAEGFHEIRLALNQLADRLLNLGDDSATTAHGLALLG